MSKIIKNINKKLYWLTAKKECCDRCGSLILPETKQRTGGLCVVCWDLKCVPPNIHMDMLNLIKGELDCGNRVWGVGDWPRKGSVNVKMKYNFKKKTRLSSISYKDCYHSDNFIYEFVHNTTGDTVYYQPKNLKSEYFRPPEDLEKVKILEIIQLVAIFSYLVVKILMFIPAVIIFILSRVKYWLTKH